MRKLTKPPYKSVNNVYYTDCLFWDRWITLNIERRPIEAVFTLNEDKEGYINARTTFVEMRDPTGHKWAMKYLGNYAHFLRLQKASWFVEALKAWREELAIVLKSEAMAKIIEIAGTETPQAFQAAKWLADEAWIDKGIKRGRPSKEEVDKELKHLTKQASETEDDAERIGLKVINGGKT